jgi:NhaA family Na+:H+ antiporter
MSEPRETPAPFSKTPGGRRGRIAAAWERFLSVESASGVLLLAATCVALILGNSPAAETVHRFWTTTLGLEIGCCQLRLPLELWVNDGLMAIFFFVIGLEIKRELVLGELRDPRRAALPIAAAIGGMVAPACIYLLLEHGKPGARGWGIPMATDIAFVVGCMAILGPRIPHGLRVMLLSLAIVDDIGAILVIAVGYSSGLSPGWLACGLAGLGAVYVLRRLGLRRIAVYAILGTFVWYAFFRSGVHATIAGVILGLMTPARNDRGGRQFVAVLRRAGAIFGGERWQSSSHRAVQVRRLQRALGQTIAPLEYLEGTLHPWVAFLIMPVFALANAGVEVHVSALGHPVAVAVALGLLLGKPAGILLAVFLAVRSGLARLPERTPWSLIAAGGVLSGIGFTMALFIAGLALDEGLLASGKIGILAGSALSAILGMGLMRLCSRLPAA